MTIAEFIARLREHAGDTPRFLLPDGGYIPVHAHVTEVGRVDRRFVDCGGTVRTSAACVLQTWVADDTDHRLLAGKLADIIEKAAPLLQTDTLPVEIEYEEFLVSQFPVAGIVGDAPALTFALVTKHTDCLAKEICLPAADDCCAGSGCC
jgi:Family of unknown function (DUF6428)